MRLSEAIDALLVATIADGRSRRTVDNYRQLLAALVRFLGDVEVEQVTIADLRRYITHLRTRPSRYTDHPKMGEVPGGLALASVASHVRAVKRLFNFLHEEGLISSNPAKRLKMPKVPRGEPKAYDLDDFYRLLAATEGDDPISRRDRALLLFLADTGCRVGGLVGLRVQDLDLDRRLARLTEKGGKTRLVPFSEPTRDALAAWLAVRPADKGDYLWTNLGTRGAPALTVEGVRQVLLRLKRKAGVRGPVNPHAFRHGFAREYLLSGGDLSSLADLLGHADVHTTWAFYAIFRMKELSEKHDQHSPIARMGREGEL